MGAFGAAFAFVIALLNDSVDLYENGFWFGWNWVVWVVVLIQAIGGLIIAMVMKYADNIMKGFASSLSIILSSILSVYFFDFSLSMVFGVGTGLVCLAIYVYQLPDPTPPASTGSQIV